jgi:hypothetical protein
MLYRQKKVTIIFLAAFLMGLSGIIFLKIGLAQTLSGITGDTILPTISSLYIENITASDVHIKLDTDKETLAIVEYGTTSSVYTKIITESNEYKKNHDIFLSGLMAGTRYYFRIYLRDSKNNKLISPEYSFVTLPQILPSSFAPPTSTELITTTTFFEASSSLFMSSTSLETITTPLPISKVLIKAVDELNNPLAEVGVLLDTVSASGETLKPSKPNTSFFKKTDSNGTSIFDIPAGTYYLRAFINPGTDLIPPDEQKLDIEAGKDINITLIFKKSEKIERVSINGIVKLEDGTPIEAFVWAFSDKGGSIKTKAAPDGNFIFKVPINTRWFMGAAKEVDGIPYKSNQQEVTVISSDVRIEIILVKISPTQLAPPVVVEKPTSEQIVVETRDGAMIRVPPLAAVPTGKISVEIKPIIEVPNTPGAKVVGTVYDITIKDETGASIKTLQKEIEISIPYNEAEIKAQGIEPDNLVPSFLDESLGVWVKIENYIINKEKKVVTFKINHLTRFALVAPLIDNIPPSSPKKIFGRRSGYGKIALSWTNPTEEDFSFARIYRSLEKGILGAVAFAKVTSNSVEDTGLKVGQVYYYTIRAVDSSNNESNNLDQVALVVSDSEDKVTKFTRNLKLGSKGEDVKALQILLIQEGVYPEAKITGRFDKFTKAAVARFQEKYATEILKPSKLTRGTGYFGRFSRMKANAILNPK